MNWKERRHKRLRKRATRTLLAREMRSLKKGKWRKIYVQVFLFKHSLRGPIHERA